MKRSVSSGVHAVKTEDYRALDLCIPVSLATLERAQQVPERPRKHRICRIQESNEQSPKGREHCETCAGPGIGVRGSRGEDGSGY